MVSGADVSVPGSGSIGSAVAVSKTYCRGHHFVTLVALMVNGFNHGFVSYNVCTKQAYSVIDRTRITIIVLPISYLHVTASKNESILPSLLFHKVPSFGLHTPFIVPLTLH